MLLFPAASCSFRLLRCCDVAHGAKNSTTEHSTEIGATLPGESSETAKEVKQIAFFPGTKSLFTGRTGVLDFDYAVVPRLWDAGGASISILLCAVSFRTIGHYGLR